MFRELLKDDGEYIIFTGHRMECYIPAVYFKTKLGERYGSDIRVFGIFNVRAFAENGKAMKVSTFNFPSMLTLHPADIEEVSLTLLEGDAEPEEYVVAKFYKGSRIMRNAVPKDSTNVELFIGDLFIKGKIPMTIPYSQLINVWMKNLSVNDIKLDVVSSILECVIAQFYRDAAKPERRFGQTAGKNPSTSDYAYKPATIRELCARNSTFAAITFEDMDSMLTSSLNISKYGKEESESPLEKIIKM